MPTCVICGTSFALASWSSPAEPCDCGAELSRGRARDLDPARVRELQRRWLEPSTDQSHFNQDGTLKVSA